MAILYKTSPLTYWIARMVVNIEHIGIVNILAKRGVVPEFIQQGATRDSVLPAALDLIGDTAARRRMIEDLRAVREGLGGVSASDRAAERIIGLLEGTAHG
jgi:lipid-A-disaccharide synthase